MSSQRETDRADLSAFLDGQLPPDRAQQIAAALEADPDLRAELQALEATRTLLTGLPTQAAPEGLHDAVMEQLERRRLLHAPATPQTAHPLRWVRHLATAAIVLLTVGLGIYLHNVLSKPDWVARVEDAESGGPELARRIDTLPPAPMKAPYAAGGADADAVPTIALKHAPARDVAGTLAGYEAHLSKAPGNAPATEVPVLGDAPVIGTVVLGNELVSVEAEELRRRGRMSKAGRDNAYMGQLFAGQRGTTFHSLALTTNDVAQTSRRVGEVLKGHRILPLDADGDQVAQELSMQMMSRSNSFYNVRPSPDVNKIVFYVSADQAGEIMAQLAALQPVALVARPASAARSNVTLSKISAGEDAAVVKGELQMRGSETGGAGMGGMGGGMGMGGMRMGGAAYGGDGMGRQAPPTLTAAADRRVDSYEPAADGSAGRAKGNPVGSPLVAKSTADGNDALTVDGTVVRGMLREPGDPPSVKVEPRFNYGTRSVQRASQADAVQAWHQSTFGMGRLVQVVVTISKREPAPAATPGPAATQPATTTQPAPTSQPAP